MKGWLLTGVAGLAAPAMAADKPIYAPPPSWVIAAPAPDPGKLGDDAPLFLTLDTQDRLADGTVWSYRDVATRMATPEVVQQAGTLALDWQPAKGDLTIHRVEIVRGAQHIDALGGGKLFTVIRREQQLEQQSIDGQLTATLAVEGLQVGDILRVTFSTSRHEETLGGAVQDVTLVPTAPARIGFARTRLLWPAATPVHWKLGFGTTSAREGQAGADREVLIDRLLPTVPDLPADVPGRFRKLPVLESSSFADWAAVSRVMAPLYATAGTIKPGGALAAEVAAIAARTTDPLRRADAALELVQGKVRYLFNGLDRGNYVPQSPEQTWTLRYGDCKAKTLLLAAMLDALGVKAEPVLANLGAGDAVTERLPSAAAFNHVLVRATIGGADYWLDGTGAGTRYADLGDVPPLRWVLPVRAAGAALLAVPSRPPSRPDATILVDLDSRAGVALPTLATLTLTVRGQAAAFLGLAKTQGTADQKREAVQKIVDETVGGNAVVADYAIAYDPADAVATITATGVAPALWTRAEDRWRLRLDKTVDKIGFDPDRANPLWRDLPVSTGNPGAGQIAIRVHLPGGGAGFAFDGDTSFAAPLAATTIHRTAMLTGALAQVSDDMAATGAEIAPADVAATRAAVTQAKARLLTLVAPAATAPRWQQVQAARATGTLAPLLAGYTAAIAARPDKADAYGDRADFLVSVYDWKAALPDMDRDIALEPTVNRHLARAYALQVTGQGAKALADLQAAHRLEPGSLDAVTALARYLVDHGQKDAGLALAQERIDAGGKDKAAALSARGVLQARGGDRDAGLASMDAALALKPSDPSLLNERCWMKAQLDRQLDTALKDCTKAIELSDDTASALDSRALVYWRLHRPDDALADLQAALDQEPDQAGSLYLRGIIEGQTGKAADSRRDLAAATMISPLVATEYQPFGIVP